MYEDDREMRKMDDAMEANLNDELNETEREAVDPIFEKGRNANRLKTAIK